MGLPGEAGPRGMRLGEILIERGKIEPEDLERALSEPIIPD